MRCLSAFALLAVLMPVSANGGELIIRNVSPSTLTCHVDGYTSATGWEANWDIRVEPGQVGRIEPSYKRDRVAIDWAECGGLKTRRMNVTPSGADGLILFTGKQSRVLNVALYPDIPSHPNGNFATLLDHIVNVFQTRNSDVLLNLVMADEDTIYSFDALPSLFGADGYDIVELDTLYLGFLASNNLITPAKITGDAPWPAARDGSTVDGVLYGVPSWLCMDFIFSYSEALKSVHTLKDFLEFAAKAPKTKPVLLADYDGSWRLPSIYINGFVQTYGYQNIAKAMMMPPDPAVIGNLKALVGTCDLVGRNPCIDGSNHGQADGTIDRLFAAGSAESDMGFSEQSFYVLLNRLFPGDVAVIPATWGERPQPLLYSDAFVTSKSSCSSEPCQSDSAAFTALMTSADMKSYIAFSGDLSPDMPPRHLLVATKPFWETKLVKGDAIYQQVRTAVENGKAFPNNFSKQQELEMGSGICHALKAQIPGYSCKE